MALGTWVLFGKAFEFSSPPSPPRVQPIGKTQRVGDLEVTVHGVRESQGELILRPSMGSKWVIVDVSARNRSRNTYFFTALFQTHLRDRDGRNYNTLVVRPQLRGVFDGTIPGGGTLRGEVAFEVPQNAVGLVFLFQELQGPGQALWALE